jgi:hypothetical protein
VEEDVQVMGNRHNMDPFFLKCSPLKVEDKIELSLVVRNISVEHFVVIALDAAGHKPTTWPRYLKNSFVVWPHGPARLQQFLHELSSVRPTIEFTLDAEANDTLLLLSILILKRGPIMAMEVYQ